ncbi:PadR family transcriptional regulator [Myxococcota bacterium]|nr:PadR family transcriptional regulator [Myxococcota bacterium]
MEQPHAGETLPPPNDKEIILLGLLAEKPRHAYELEEIVRERKMDEWTNLASSSIYRVLGKLLEKGFVKTHLDDEGRGAVRKVHTITPRGREAMLEGILYFLGDMSPVKLPLHVGLAFITRAPLSEAKERIHSRLQPLREGEQMLEAVEKMILGELENCEDPDAGARKLSTLLLFSHIREHIRAEFAFYEKAEKLLSDADPKMFADGKIRVEEN